MKKLCFLAALLTTLSCTHSVTSPAKPQPVIIVNTPSDNQHFVQGDTIHVTGIVTHSVPLIEVAVHMTDHSTNNEFFHNHFVVDNKLEYTFDAKYVIPDNKKATYKVEVEGLDKYGTSAIKDLTITIN